MNKSLRNKDASGVYFPALTWGSASPGHIEDRILLTLRMDLPLAAALSNSSFLGKTPNLGWKMRNEGKTGALP